MINKKINKSKIFQTTIKVLVTFTIICSLTTTVNAFPRFITDKDGRSLLVNLIGKTGTSVEVQRVSDSRIFLIPLQTLSKKDKNFVENWKPQPQEIKKIQKASPSHVKTTIIQSGFTTRLPYIRGHGFPYPYGSYGYHQYGYKSQTEHCRNQISQRRPIITIIKK